MSRRHLDLTNTRTASAAVTSLSIPELSRLANDWLSAGQLRLPFPSTIATRRLFVKKLLLFLQSRNLQQCGTAALKQFFAYLPKGHLEAGGRWGNPQIKKAPCPISVKGYFVNFSSMLKWLMSEGDVEVSPMERLPVPKVRASQIQPLSNAHIVALIQAAKKSSNPKRDTPNLLFLLDCGLQASEFGTLKIKDADLEMRRCGV